MLCAIIGKKALVKGSIYREAWSVMSPPEEQTVTVTVRIPKSLYDLASKHQKALREEDEQYASFESYVLRALGRVTAGDDEYLAWKH
jgi:hypothetical protein